MMLKWTDTAGATVKRVWPLFVLCTLVVVLTAVSSGGSETTQRTATELLILMVVAVGLYIFSGNSGILSFGHISFMAVGAYTAGLLTMPALLKSRPPFDHPEWLINTQLPYVEAVVIGGVIAAVIGLIVAVPLMRLSGLAAGIATFSVLIIVREIIRNWNSLTGGLQTLVGVPIKTTLWSAMAWALVAIVVAFIYQESRWGLRLRASREDEAAAATSGVNIEKERRIAFVISAFVVGVGGGLYGHYLGAFSPNSFFIPLTFITIAMLVVGGINSLTGAVIGIVVVYTVGEALRRIEGGFDWGFVSFDGLYGLREVGLSVLMLLILIFRPRGLAGDKEVPWPGENRWLRATIKRCLGRGGKGEP